MEIEAAGQQRGLSREAFDRLLLFLDADRSRAGEKYERLRQRLVSFFRWRACVDPEHYTDRTIDRVARRLLEGAELRVTDPYVYFHGVALNVLREHWREPGRKLLPLDGVGGAGLPATDPAEVQRQEAERLEMEQRLDCLGGCLDHLPAGQRQLIVIYHQGDERARIVARRELARQLIIPMNALRIRVYRIRRALEACVEECLKRPRSSERDRDFAH
jgi:DNA-directed RNA polymerase specialized sigma24 family protein